jgi:hypothetical protein
MCSCVDMYLVNSDCGWQKSAKVLVAGRLNLYVRMFVCISVCMYVCKNARVTVAGRLYMYVRMFVCISVCMYVRMPGSRWQVDGICMYVCMYARVYMYLCMYVYEMRRNNSPKFHVHIYTHTHTHTHKISCTYTHTYNICIHSWNLALQIADDIP